jgi:hypothetical protein
MRIPTCVEGTGRRVADRSEIPYYELSEVLRISFR